MGLVQSGGRNGSPCARKQESWGHDSISSEQFEGIMLGSWDGPGDGTGEGPGDGSRLGAAEGAGDGTGVGSQPSFSRFSSMHSSGQHSGHPI